MKLKELLNGISYTVLQGNEGTEISGIAYDSRKVKEGFLFVCMRGATVDGHRFAGSAVEGGAAALLVEEPVELPAESPSEILYFRDGNVDIQIESDQF